jgi:hypothetical protein
LFYGLAHQLLGGYTVIDSRIGGLKQYGDPADLRQMLVACDTAGAETSGYMTRDLDLKVSSESTLVGGTVPRGRSFGAERQERRKLL